MSDCTSEKKRKHEDSSNGSGGDAYAKILPFEDFTQCKILNENSQRKMICVHGKFKNKDENAVVILEKTPFSSKSVSTILSDVTQGQLTLQNDIYGTYQLHPPAEVNGIKSTLIYPATEKHIAKYSDHEMFVVEETADDYNSITRPHLDKEKFSTQWVYNILEKKCEADRIVFEDPDPETGFILLPDMKWDRKQMEDLYLVAIVHKHGIRSIRELDESHLPLLKNILDKGKAAILEKFSLPSSKLRIYLHYQPSYYHLHVHFTHIKYDAPGSGVERAHLLSDVVENIELNAAYYQKKSLTFVVKENDSLYHKFKDAGRLACKDES